MIKVHDYYYETGGCHGRYCSRTSYINGDDISVVKEFYSREYDCKSKVIMKSGDVLDCKETVDEILRGLEK